MTDQPAPAIAEDEQHPIVAINRESFPLEMTTAEAQPDGSIHIQFLGAQLRPKVYLLCKEFRLGPEELMAIGRSFIDEATKAQATRAGLALPSTAAV